MDISDALTLPGLVERAGVLLIRARMWLRPGRYPTSSEVHFSSFQASTEVDGSVVDVLELFGGDGGYSLCECCTPPPGFHAQLAALGEAASTLFELRTPTTLIGLGNFFSAEPTTGLVDLDAALGDYATDRRAELLASLDAHRDLFLPPGPDVPVVMAVAEPWYWGSVGRALAAFGRYHGPLVATARLPLSALTLVEPRRGLLAFEVPELDPDVLGAALTFFEPFGSVDWPTALELAQRL